MSGSRAAQGQSPIGLLNASMATVLLPARWCFGACDEFRPKKTWTEVAAGLVKGSLALALLTCGDLVQILKTPKARHEFLAHFSVVGDFPTALDGEPQGALVRKIFIVTLRGKGASCEASQILILIECKSTVNAVKSLVNFMHDRPLHAELLPLGARSAQGGMATALVRLSLPKLRDGISATSQLLMACKRAGFPVSILGVYPGSEIYGG